MRIDVVGKQSHADKVQQQMRGAGPVGCLRAAAAGWWEGLGQVGFHVGLKDL